MRITNYRWCNFGSKIKMRQIWRFQTLCWMLSEKALFNFDALNYFLGQKTGFCATAFICRRIGWWLGKILRWVQKIMSLPFRFFFSPLTDAGSRVNFAKSLILHGWMQSWYPMRRNSRSACCSSTLKKHQDRWDLKGCCCGREVFSPIICSLAKIEHKACTVANMSSGTF